MKSVRMPGTSSPPRQLGPPARNRSPWQPAYQQSMVAFGFAEEDTPRPSRQSLQRVPHRCPRTPQFNHGRRGGFWSTDSTDFHRCDASGGGDCRQDISSLPSESVPICEICVPILCLGRKVSRNRRWTLTRNAMCSMRDCRLGRGVSERASFFGEKCDIGGPLMYCGGQREVFGTRPLLAQRAGETCTTLQSTGPRSIRMPPSDCQRNTEN